MYSFHLDFKTTLFSHTFKAQREWRWLCSVGHHFHVSNLKSSNFLRTEEITQWLQRRYCKSTFYRSQKSPGISLQEVWSAYISYIFLVYCNETKSDDHFQNEQTESLSTGHQAIPSFIKPWNSCGTTDVNHLLHHSSEIRTITFAEWQNWFNMAFSNPWIYKILEDVCV